MRWYGDWRPRDFRPLLDRSRQQIQAAGQSSLLRVAELLFPPVCLICGVMDSELTRRICTACERTLVDETTRRCPRCAKPLPQYSVANAGGCPLCRNKKWRFDRVLTLGTYGGKVREVVLKIKQVRNEPLCMAVGELLADRVQSELQDDMPDVIVSVPMYWLRKLVRGTNDSELISEAISKQLKIRYTDRAVRCVRPTRKQGTLYPNERRLNVRGAYAVRSTAMLQDKHVLIADDVMTTGATAHELARVLLRAGARRVTVAVVARGVGFG